ncbi:hypothetical protein C6P46_005012 [Rhodotorula mucilaginosa]|uniref:Uncharacterized protein n=1 Tax=Rhodotorula mucilaginosa TaxID=5537 RepID=A0A9P6W1I6_RHOMI|nr:hypothetical protein C6P46_005012 [Rhodotorula mucilaginosa]
MLEQARRVPLLLPPSYTYAAVAPDVYSASSASSVLLRLPGPRTCRFHARRPDSEMPRSAAADVPYPPRNHAITAVETPFGRDAHALSEYPWRLEPGSFERLISYAWVVYLRASKCGGAQGPAHEWACAFERAFALPTRSNQTPSAASWCKKLDSARRVLPLSLTTTYAGLSHRLLKFYQELQDIAENIATATSRRVWHNAKTLLNQISIFDYGEVAVKAFFNNMIAARDELTRAFNDALNGSQALRSSCWLPSPPDISFLQEESSWHPAYPHAEETFPRVHALGQVGLRRFHGLIGRRSARRYGIDPRDAWN